MEFQNNVLEPLANAEANIRRGRRVTYTKALRSEIQNYANNETNPVEEFLNDFSHTISKRQDEFQEICEEYPKTVGRFYNELVPRKLSHEEFWQRYFYRCNPEFIMKEWFQFDIKQGFNDAMDNCQESLKSFSLSVDHHVKSALSNRSLDDYRKWNNSQILSNFQGSCTQQIAQIEKRMSQHYEEVYDLIQITRDDVVGAIFQREEEAEEKLMKNALKEASDRRSRRTTYTEPLRNKMNRYTKDEEKYISDFVRWFKKRDLTSELCESVCDAYPWTVARFYAELVPDTVSHEDFWQRYCYRCDPDRIIGLWECREKKQKLEKILKARETKNQREDKEEIEVGLIERSTNDVVYVIMHEKRQEEVLNNHNSFDENRSKMQDVYEVTDHKSSGCVSDLVYQDLQNSMTVTLAADRGPNFDYSHLFERLTIFLMKSWRRQLVVSTYQTNCVDLEQYLQCFIPSRNPFQSMLEEDGRAVMYLQGMQIKTPVNSIKHEKEEKREERQIEPQEIGDRELLKAVPDEEKKPITTSREYEKSQESCVSSNAIEHKKDADCQSSRNCTVQLIQEQMPPDIHESTLDTKNEIGIEEDTTTPDRKKNITRQSSISNSNSHEDSDSSQDNSDNTRDNSLKKLLSRSFTESEEGRRKEGMEEKAFKEIKGSSNGTSMTGDLTDELTGDSTGDLVGDLVGDLSSSTTGNEELQVHEYYLYSKTGHLIEAEYELKSRENRNGNILDNIVHTQSHGIPILGGNFLQQEQVLNRGEAPNVDWELIQKEVGQELEASIGEVKMLWESTVKTLLSATAESSKNILKLGKDESQGKQQTDEKSGRVDCYRKSLSEQESKNKSVPDAGVVIDLKSFNRDDCESVCDQESTREQLTPALGVVVDVAPVEFICEDITVSDDDQSYITTEKESKPNGVNAKDEVEVGYSILGQGSDETQSIGESLVENNSPSSSNATLYKFRSIAAAAEAQLRRRREETYTTPLRNGSNHTYDDNEDYIEFLLDFRSTFESQQNEYRKICREYPSTVGRFYRKLVPKQVSAENFWQRYIYKCSSDRIMKEWDRAASTGFGQFW